MMNRDREESNLGMRTEDVEELDYSNRMQSLGIVAYERNIATDVSQCG